MKNLIKMCKKCCKSTKVKANTAVVHRNKNKNAAKFKA